MRAALAVSRPRRRREALHARLPRAVQGEVPKVGPVVPPLRRLCCVPLQVSLPARLPLIVPPEVDAVPHKVAVGLGIPKGVGRGVT